MTWQQIIKKIGLDPDDVAASPYWDEEVQALIEQLGVQGIESLRMNKLLALGRIDGWDPEHLAFLRSIGIIKPEDDLDDWIADEFRDLSNE